MSQATQARRYFVSGIVQGVGFRFFAQETARHLGLAGCVRNLPDGRVEAYAMGAPEKLEAFRRALERGPMGATVSGVEMQTADVDRQYAGDFTVTFV